MLIQIDTREKKHAIGKIMRQFEENQIDTFRKELPVGDYFNWHNPSIVVDRKQNLQEVCQNVCQDHRRFVAELDLCKQMGLKMIILVEHSPNVKTLEDVQAWNNPRLATSPKAVTGEKLYKILHSIEVRHGCKFMFCSKGETGLKIIELLKE